MDATLTNYLEKSNDKMFNVVLDWRNENDMIALLVKRGGIITNDSVGLPEFQLVFVNRDKTSTANYLTLNKAIIMFKAIIEEHDLTNKGNKSSLKSTLEKLYTKAICIDKYQLNTILNEVVEIDPSLSTPIENVKKLIGDIMNVSNYQLGKSRVEKLMTRYRNNPEISDRLRVLLNYL